MDITEDLFKDRSKIPDFICPICSGFPIDPVKDHCDHLRHTFCRECLSEWMAVKYICPVSKSQINPKKIVPDLEMIQAADHLEVKCANFYYKCTWAGTLKDLREHLKICTKRPLIFRSRLFRVFGSQGNACEYTIPWQNIKQKDLELDSIVMEFSTSIYFDGTLHSNWYSLSSIQLIWRYKDPLRKEMIFGAKFGGKVADYDPANVERHEVFKIDRGDALEQIILFTGSYYYPRIGFKTVNNPQKFYFGYHQLASGSMTIEIPNDCEIVGAFGKDGWMIDALGLVFQYKHFEEKI